MWYLHFILASPALPVHLVEIERLEVDPVDGAHVDGQFALHGGKAHTFDVLESVRDVDAARRTESVLGSFGPELVEGEVLAAVEGDALLGRIEPEGRVLVLC